MGATVNWRERPWDGQREHPCWICGEGVDVSGDFTLFEFEIRTGFRQFDEMLHLAAHGQCVMTTIDSSQRGGLLDLLRRNHEAHPRHKAVERALVGPARPMT